MNNIIQQICENYISEILNFFDTDIIRTLDEMETELKKKTDNYIRIMIKTYLEGLDEAIAEDKASRKKKGYVVEQKWIYVNIVDTKTQIFMQFFLKHLQAVEESYNRYCYEAFFCCTRILYIQI